MTFESTAFSRIRNESAALINPSPVHEGAATTITKTSAGTDERGMWTPRMRLLAARAKAATNAPFRTHWDGAPEEERDPPRRADENRAQGVLVALASCSAWGSVPSTSDWASSLTERVLRSARVRATLSLS